MKHTTPFTVQLNSIADVDNAARALSDIWEQSFSPAPRLDGRKKNKLRDMVCRMAGYPNGFKAFVAELNASQISLPTMDFDLPDDLIINTDIDLNFLFIGTDTDCFTLRRGDTDLLQPDSEDFLTALYAEPGYFDDVPGFDYNDNDIPLRDNPMWQYIAAHYIVKRVRVNMPRIDKYGASDLCDAYRMATWLKECYLPTTALQAEAIVEHHDRGDDGGETLGLWLTRKATL
jgi:hypothetical protein